jgi:exopolysaccharide biosynthesis protein
MEIGGSKGADLLEVIEILTRYRAYNAVNFDGGASTTLVVNNKLYNKPCGYGGTGERRVPNA